MTENNAQLIAEGLKKQKILERMRIAITEGKLNDFCNIPKESKTDQDKFRIKLALLCHKYNELKQK